MFTLSNSTQIVCTWLCKKNKIKLLPCLVLILSCFIQGSKAEISFGDSGVKGLHVLLQHTHPGQCPLDRSCFITDVCHESWIQRANRVRAHVAIGWILDSHTNMKLSRLWGKCCPSFSGHSGRMLMWRFVFLWMVSWAKLFLNSTQSYVITAIMAHERYSHVWLVRRCWLV